MYTPVYRVELVRERQQRVNSKLVANSTAAIHVVREFLRGADREVFVVMGLTTKSRLIGISIVSIGSLQSTVVHPREVFKPAILMNAAQIIIAHNHPSGDSRPSQEDAMVTQRLIRAGTIMGIDVIDHLILGEFDGYSMREKHPDWKAIAFSDPKEIYESTPRKKSPRRTVLPPFRHQTYEHTDGHGTIRAWDVTAGLRIAADGRPTVPFNLRELDLTIERIETLYQGIDSNYAMSTNLSRPLLYIPFFGAILVIDGWHRMWKAANLGIPELSVWRLNKEEADSIKWLELSAKSLRRP
jgi:DNA repair protein RadC